MSHIILTVTDLMFPADLLDKYTAFRLKSIFAMPIRRQFEAGNGVTPGAEENDHWECEKKNKKRQNFVRHPTLPKIDTTKVDVASR